MNKYYYNKDYNYQKTEKNGETQYFVSLKGSNTWINVSKEIYELLIHGEWNEKKFLQREGKRSISFSLENELGKSVESTLQDSKIPKPEEVFIRNAWIEDLKNQLCSLCSDEEIELLVNVVLDKVPLTEYAKQKGIPRSTMESRKLALLKRLKKFWNFF